MRARHAHPDALSMQAKLTALNLPFMRENYQSLAHTAADKHWSHVDYFTELLSGEAAAREDRRVQRCIRQASFPVVKTGSSRKTASSRWPMQATRATPSNHRASGAIAVSLVIATTFVMHAMVGRQSRQVKMPRPDAYCCPAKTAADRDPVEQVSPRRTGRAR